jgi:hypothetical protein
MKVRVISTLRLREVEAAASAAEASRSGRKIGG